MENTIRNYFRGKDLFKETTTYKRETFEIIRNNMNPASNHEKYSPFPSYTLTFFHSKGIPRKKVNLKSFVKKF